MSQGTPGAHRCLTPLQRQCTKKVQNWAFFGVFSPFPAQRASFPAFSPHFRTFYPSQRCPTGTEQPRHRPEQDGNGANSTGTGQIRRARRVCTVGPGRGTRDYVVEGVVGMSGGWLLCVLVWLYGWLVGHGRAAGGGTSAPAPAPQSSTAQTRGSPCTDRPPGSPGRPRTAATAAV